MQEWHQYVSKTMSRRYTRESYDVLTYNCNTFSNDGVHFLTGGSIPSTIIDLPKLALESRTGVLLRPFLNKWLGGFGNDNSSGMQDGDTNLGEASAAEIVQKLTLGKGRIVVVKGAGINGEDVLATICNVEDEEHCEVNFFDPEQCAFVQKSVNREQVERTKTDYQKAVNKQQTWVPTASEKAFGAKKSPVTKNGKP